MSEIISNVFNIDCLEYMKTLPDKCFDLCIADPPYGINIGNGLGSGKKSCKMHHEWQFNAPTQEVFEEIFRISKNQIIWGGNYFNLPLCDNWIVWDKLNPNLSFAEGKLAWCSIHRKLRIFKHYSAKVDGGTKIHPTQKPIALYSWILDNYAKEGDKIFDPFLGSGSSRIAAYMKGFDFYACELDKEYYDLQEKRFKEKCFGEVKVNDKIIVQQQDLF